MIHISPDLPPSTAVCTVSLDVFRHYFKFVGSAVSYTHIAKMYAIINKAMPSPLTSGL